MDPGWKSAIGGVWRAFVPWIGMRSVKGKPALVGLRSVWLSAVASWIGFGIILSLLDTGRNNAAPVRVFVAGMGVLDVGLIAWLRRRPVTTRSAEDLRSAYSQSSFIGFALADAAVLFGFVGFFLGGGILSYLIGAAFGAVSFVLAAPTRANLDRIQRQIRLSGSPLSLVGTMSEPGTPGLRSPASEPGPG